MTGDEKQAFANEAEKALDHELVQKVIDESMENLSNYGIAMDNKLVRRGFLKVAMYTATVARALAMGIDPEELRMTPLESNQSILEQTRRVSERGIPVVVVVDEGVDP